MQTSALKSFAGFEHNKWSSDFDFRSVGYGPDRLSGGRGRQEVLEFCSIPLITALVDMGARVRAYDPEGMEQAKSELPAITYCENAYSAAWGADALVIVTEWEQFRALDLERIKTDMNVPNVVDLRNIYRPEEMKALGFRYESIGRPPMPRHDPEKCELFSEKIATKQEAKAR